MIVSGSSGGLWLIVIHGGAWRDPKVTAESGRHVAELLAPYFSGWASVEYRLSPSVQHPVHMNDVALEIGKICSDYGPDKVVLLGHSAGAFIAGQVAPLFNCKAIICLEGIYSLTELIDEYPSYRYFVEEAFGGVENWESATPMWSRLSCPITAVHSSGDELLSARQSEWLVRQNRLATLVPLDAGSHDEVFEKYNLIPALRRYTNILEDKA